MNTEDYSNLIPLNYLNIALDAKKTRDKKIRLLLEKVSFYLNPSEKKSKIFCLNSPEKDSNQRMG